MCGNRGDNISLEYRLDTWDSLTVGEVCVLHVVVYAERWPLEPIGGGNTRQRPIRQLHTTVAGTE